jgi:hypothetical protein
MVTLSFKEIGISEVTGLDVVDNRIEYYKETDTIRHYIDDVLSYEKTGHEARAVIDRLFKDDKKATS